jgi:hypothetical protein
VEWRVWFTKRDGSLRKQFRSWSVPTFAHGVEDGDQLDLRADYPGGVFAGSVRVTSGGEFNLPKAVADAVSVVAAAVPDSCIVFRIPDVDTITQSDDAAAGAQDGTHAPPTEGQPPERREYARELFLRNRRYVLELKSLYGGVCQITGQPVCDGIAGDLTEAHHIEWLTRGGVDAPSNMIIVSPDMHAAIHACDGWLDWEGMQPVFVLRSRRLPLAVNKHLCPMRG